MNRWFIAHYQMMLIMWSKAIPPKAWLSSNHKRSQQHVIRRDCRSQMMSGYTDYVIENCMNSLCLNISHIQMAAQLYYLEFTCGVCQDNWKSCKALIKAPAEITVLVIHSNRAIFFFYCTWQIKQRLWLLGKMIFSSEGP